ncbi:hypothetical protein [Bradyrhizobium sp. SBR1B]|uniref:hypothetical protein n=1 Tax=Bradyrhizobium sp. SBR1B TaxID=2663836 RepID=UPI001606F04D|nr:hypothetical protein [Bradyrhizobium sp. SBR1B]MBB4380719.1 hypothetical protein [Bradyrhizobium sp. SBR1B]
MNVSQLRQIRLWAATKTPLGTPPAPGILHEKGRFLAIPLRTGKLMILFLEVALPPGVFRSELIYPTGPQDRPQLEGEGIDDPHELDTSFDFPQENWLRSAAFH